MKVNPRAWFCSLVTLQTVITAPGRYVTRSGEEVVVAKVSDNHDFGCRGAYSGGATEGWHKSGRLYFGKTCNNDIVRAA